MEILFTLYFSLSHKVYIIIFLIVINAKKLFYPSVCPSIWLIELDKLDGRIAVKEAREALLYSNYTTAFPMTSSRSSNGFFNG